MIGVHCTHGINRTGYIVCMFLKQHFADKSIEEIIELFESKRGCKIQKDYIIADLIMKYSKNSKDVQELTKEVEAITIGNPEETSNKKK